jgi:hypothetical protein
MKKLKSTLLVALLMTTHFANVSCLAKEVGDDSDKLYVASEAVQIIDDQIIVTTEDGQVTVSALYAGDDGLYIYMGDSTEIIDDAIEAEEKRG